jgi:hypothetical protein
LTPSDPSQAAHLVLGGRDRTLRGFGVEIPALAQEQFPTSDDGFHDMMEEVFTNWPLLSFELSGNYWANQPNCSVLCVASTVIPLSFAANHSVAGFTLPSAEELASLDDFITRFIPGVQPGWMMWSYSG